MRPHISAEPARRPTSEDRDRKPRKPYPGGGYITVAQVELEVGRRRARRPYVSWALTSVTTDQNSIADPDHDAEERK
jgi:hypothetical protein